MNNRNFTLLFAALALSTSLALSSCEVSNNSVDTLENTANNKEFISYNDIVRSSKNSDLDPKKTTSENKYSLHDVKPHILELNNGNVVESYVYNTVTEAEAAYQEFNEREAMIQFMTTPQLFQIKNALIIYYDNQVTNFIKSL